MAGTCSDQYRPGWLREVFERNQDEIDQMPDWYLKVAGMKRRDGTPKKDCCPTCGREMVS